MAAQFNTGAGRCRRPPRDNPGRAYTGGAGRPPSIDGVARRAYSQLQSYDGVHRSVSDVFMPASVDELRAVFRYARSRGRRISFRAGAQSFDGQALNDDIVVSMLRFDSIAVDAERERVTVGAGASWGAIVRALEPFGLVPFVVVSTSAATAGGTVSGDCLSRFSGCGGKEGRFVERLELMTLDGRVRTLTPDGDTSALFHAVVGGLGYFGAVLSVTYRVARVAPSGPLRVVTRVSHHTTLRDLAENLVPEIGDAHLGPPGDCPPEAIYSIAYRTAAGTRGVVLRSRYVPASEAELRPMLTHRPTHPLRVPIEWLVRVSVLSEGLWTIIDRWFFDFERPYVDDLVGYTFFMDGNVLSKKVGQALGMPLSTVQQTYMIPFDWSARDESMRRLVRFLRTIERVTTLDGTPPTLFDILHVQADDFLLSSNRGLDAFAVTLAFETSNEDNVRSIRSRLAALSGRALALGGRVHLVKDVYATPEHLEAMYAGALPEVVRLKRLVDPEGLLRNAFLERVFPACFPPRRPSGER